MVLKKRSSVDDLMNMEFLSDLKASPDQKRALFVRTKINEKKNRYERDLYLCDEACRLRRLTSDGKMSAPFWGESAADREEDAVYFFAKRDEDEKKRAEEGCGESSVYRLSLRGGEAELAFTLPFSVEYLRPLKDGRFLLAAGYDLRDPERFLCGEAEKKERMEKEKELSFCRVIEEIPFYMNGASYIYGQKTRLFLYDPELHEAAKKEKCFEEEAWKKRSPEERLEAYGLTSLSGTDESLSIFEFSEEEGRLLFVLQKNKRRMETRDVLYELPLPAKNEYRPRRETEERRVLAGEKLGIGIYFVFFFRRRLYVLLSDFRRAGLNQGARLYCEYPAAATGDAGAAKGEAEVEAAAHCPSAEAKLSPVAGVLHLVSEQEFFLGNSVGSDARYGGSSSFKVEDEAVYFIVTEGDRARLCRLDPESFRFEALELCDQVEGFALRENGEILTISFEKQQPQALYLHRPVEHSFSDEEKRDLAAEHLVSLPYEVYKAYDKRRLDEFNEAWKEATALPVEHFLFESGGDLLKGFVLRPEPFEEGKKYPAILDIHGGPRTVYGALYYHEMQYWASRGYFVFFTNPHGSDGRGDAFADLFGHYGEQDYRDLMTLTDEVLRRYPAVDAERLGVTGGSYGGFMTNWITTHTDRFKAAATQRSITNWISFWGTSDIGYYFVQDQCRGDIYGEEGLRRLWQQSPLAFVRHHRTPTLIIHSEEDYRCPLEQAVQWFTALTDLGIETRLVQFKGENHDLSRSGKPKARRKRLEEITAWMDRFLKTEEERLFFAAQDGEVESGTSEQKQKEQEEKKDEERA